MLLTENLKADMKKNMERLEKLDEISQIVIISKIDALYERQLIDEERQQVAGTLPRTG